ncbi:solute carrier organic anion transporter family member 2B1-like [Arapaima gigas]
MLGSSTKPVFLVQSEKLSRILPGTQSPHQLEKRKIASSQSKMRDMKANGPSQTRTDTRRCAGCTSPFNSIKFFVFCHGLLQLAQLLVSGYLKGSISTIEKRYGFSSQKSGLVACFNEVGNVVLIVFVSYFGSRVHRPRWIGVGGLVASLAVFLMALPHFLSGHYQYSGSISNSLDNDSALCHGMNSSLLKMASVNCTQQESSAHQEVLPIMLIGQLLLGIGGVPIQPFGISYIDDYASKRNSPLYLGIMFAVTVIGPASGFLLGSFLLQFYVDFDKLDPSEIELNNKDPRWVGAWWLGFLLAGGLLILTSLPYFFFPRKMPKEQTAADSTEPPCEKPVQNKKDVQDLSLAEFLKAFPKIVLRTLKNPIYLLVVLAQVCLSAMVAGLATFMSKFIEQQFSKTAAFSNRVIGGINIPAAMLGIMAGGAIMRRLSMSVKTAGVMCTVVVFTAVVFGIPLLFLGCSTQSVAGVYSSSSDGSCHLNCYCDEQAFNPVCGSNGMEFRSPCHAGCGRINFNADKILVSNYSDCRCIGGDGSGFAVPGSCGTGCSHLFLPFVILCALTGFVASLSQTPSFMMILRTVKPDDKSFALGIQFMMFRVLAFMPGPVLYGSAIDTTCILWGKKCNKNTSCRYYNLNHFRQRFLGLQVFFLFGAFVCFLLALRKIKDQESLGTQKNKPGTLLLTSNPEVTARAEHDTSVMRTQHLFVDFTFRRLRKREERQGGGVTAQMAFELRQKRENHQSSPAWNTCWCHFSNRADNQRASSFKLSVCSFALIKGLLRCISVAASGDGWRIWKAELKRKRLILIGLYTCVTSCCIWRLPVEVTLARLRSDPYASVRTDSVPPGRAACRECCSHLM